MIERKVKEIFGDNPTPVPPSAQMKVRAKMSVSKRLDIARTKLMLKESVKAKPNFSKSILAAMDAKADTRKARSTFGNTTKQNVREMLKGFDFNRL